MHENIIETLLRLYAIITDTSKMNDDDISEQVEKYLRTSFNHEFVQKYQHMYDSYVRYYHEVHREIVYTDEGEGALFANQKHISNICKGISTHNDMQVRFTIINQLLNFISSGYGVYRLGLQITQTVANQLNINPDDYRNLFHFAVGDMGDVDKNDWLLIADGRHKTIYPGIKHLYRERQTVEIRFIHIPSINMLYFRYSGPRNLYLNGHRLNQNLLYPFPQGGVLKTSRMLPMYYSSVMSTFIKLENQAIIAFNVDKVEYDFNRKTKGLHELSFQEQSGELVGIIGGSGVGKTTLLNVLCGKLKPNKGKVTINGYDVHDKANEEKLSGVIGYVPQDDLLIEELTVYDNLKYNAQFCFGKMKPEQIEEKIEQTLRDFNLMEARDLVVGNPLRKILSGGQRKRLNIALELMREPSLLFVDEPTSGLSSADSEKVMYLFKKQCLKGRLVFANIHQPSSDIYKLFDRVIVMDAGGRIVFFGNPRELITYFKNEANYVNPDESECLTCGNVKTEQPLQILEARMVDPMGKTIRKRKVSAEEWYAKYKAKVEPRVLEFIRSNPVEKEEIPPTPFSRPQWMSQFRLFFKRDFASKRSNKQYLAIALLEAPILALILGFFTRYGEVGNYLFSKNNNIPPFIFMSVIVALFVGLSLSAEEIFKDRKIRQREEFLNLSKGAYLSAKIMMLFAISAFQMICFAVIGNLMLDIQGLTFGSWMVLFSTACLANLLGLNLSSGLDSAVAIYILVPLMLVPQLLLSGAIVDFNKMHPAISSPKHTPVIGDMMAARWSYEAMAVHFYTDNDYEQHFFDDEIEKNKWSFATFYYIPEVRRTVAAYQKIHDLSASPQGQLLKPILVNSLLDLHKEAPLPEALQKQVLHLKQGSVHTLSIDEVIAYLDSTQELFKQKFKQTNERLKNSYDELLNEFEGDKIALEAYKSNYVNEKLAIFVRDQYSGKKTQILDNRICQVDEPILRLPTDRNGRAHFYAPYKLVGSLKIPTVWFNIIILWMLTALLSVLLYFDVLRKLINYVQNWKKGREEHRRVNMLNNSRTASHHSSEDAAKDYHSLD
ncbi:MAG: ATP-binding cassette domain-containing protein [Mangrovibacterium sp.]